MGPPCHPRVPILSLGSFPAVASAASSCFLPELAQGGDFTPPCLLGSRISAAIHCHSNRETSGAISELVVSTLSQIMCLFLMKLMQEKSRKKKRKRLLTTDVLFHLRFTGACIFHSCKRLICRFIQNRAGTTLGGSIPAAGLGEKDLAEQTAMQGTSQSQPQILCPGWAKRPI